MSARLILLIFLVLLKASAFAQKPSGTIFKMVPLGVKGGIDESNLSAYMLAPKETNDYICLDAGTLHAGIEKAVDKQVFKVDPEVVLKDYIKAYLISHAHLDHLAGLIINSTEDSRKPIYAMEPCIDVLKNSYFNWKSWPNLANEGNSPSLNKYQYTVLLPSNEVPITGTGMHVQAYPLSHGYAYQSAAFLIKSGTHSILYLGDTGPDLIEKSRNLLQLWQAVHTLIRNKTLKGIFVEVSYPNEQPDHQLYGHLTPKWLMHELTVLSKLTGADAVKDLPIVVTHIKPAGKNEELIKKQLQEANKLNMKLIFPEQGEMLEF